MLCKPLWCLWWKTAFWTLPIPFQQTSNSSKTAHVRIWKMHLNFSKKYGKRNIGVCKLYNDVHRTLQWNSKVALCIKNWGRYGYCGTDVQQECPVAIAGSWEGEWLSNIASKPLENHKISFTLQPTKYLQPKTEKVWNIASVWHVV